MSNASDDQLPMEHRTYYFEMTSPDQLLAKEQACGLAVVEGDTADHDLCMSLYSIVGEPWRWIDRHQWREDRWATYLDDPNLSIWIAVDGDELAGFYELQCQPEGNVEIVLFGLAPNYIGKGLGGWFLTHALRTAWALDGSSRVWLHTCSWDHTHAISNYTARGMHCYKTEAGG